MARLIEDYRPMLEKAVLAEVERLQRRDETLMRLADQPGTERVYMMDTSAAPVIVVVGPRTVAFQQKGFLETCIATLKESGVFGSKPE